MFSIAFLLLFGVFAAAQHSKCPCEDKTLCEPIKGPKRVADNEIFLFSVSNSSWESYNWTAITTLAVAGMNNLDPAMVCHAHSFGGKFFFGLGLVYGEGARVGVGKHQKVYFAGWGGNWCPFFVVAARVVLLGSMAKEDLTNASARSIWISEQIELVRDYGLDGLNLDFEDYILKSETKIREGMTAWVRECTEAVHGLGDGLQLSVDVAWSPNGIDERWYDYGAIAEVSDCIFAMFYDERSQFSPPCIASANSPITLAKQGLEAWRQVAPMNKLVFGVPFYGYTYPCLSGTAPHDSICPIQPIHWRNASCSDAAGREISNDQMAPFLRNASTPISKNDTLQSLWFNYIDDQGNTNQIWMDDPETLTIKTSLAYSMGARGTGCWEIDAIDGLQPQERQKYYQALSK